MLLLGLLCKEVAVAGLVAVIVLELHHRFTVQRAPAGPGGGWGAVVARTAPALAALVLYAGLRLRAGSLDAAPAGGADPDGRTPATVLVAFTEAVGRYALMLLDPLRPRLQMGLIGYPSRGFCLVGGALLLLGVLAGGRWLLARRPSRLPGTAWAALGLAATALGLVVHLLPLNVNAVASDRFLYFPLAGLVIAAAPAAGGLWQRRPRLVALAAGLLVASFAAGTTLRARHWSDELRLWHDTIRTAHPRNVFGQLSLAHALMQRSRWADALARLREVVRIQPSYNQQPTYRGNLALCLDKLGQRGQAISLLIETTRSHPDRLRLFYNLLMAHARDRRFDRAREVAAEIRRRFPGDEHVLELTRVITEAEQDLAALPPPRPDEPVATRAARAAVFAALAAPAEAAPLWAEVAISAAAPRELREQAIGYLVSQAEPGFAAGVLDRVARGGAAGVDVELYRSVLEERVREGRD
jgi:protein O-mannosyl-transferase